MPENEIESHYARLERPNFQSMVPHHILARFSDQEKYVVESLSRLEQQQEWLVVAMLETNRIQRDLDKRLQRVESWQEKLTSKWALIMGVVVWLSPIGVKYLLEHVIPKVH
jgi:hypothetical protein